MKFSIGKGVRQKITKTYQGTQVEQGTVGVITAVNANDYDVQYVGVLSALSGVLEGDVTSLQTMKATFNGKRFRIGAGVRQNKNKSYNGVVVAKDSVGVVTDDQDSDYNVQYVGVTSEVTGVLDRDLAPLHPGH